MAKRNQFPRRHTKCGATIMTTKPKREADDECLAIAARMASAPEPDVYRWRDAVLVVWTTADGYGYTIIWGDSEQGHKRGRSYGSGDHTDGLQAGIYAMAQAFGSSDAPGTSPEFQARLAAKLADYHALSAA